MKLLDPKSLSTSSNIRDAFEILDGQFGMVVTVIDSAAKLVGVATEGNLRRALLSGSSLDESLERVMNRNPVTISSQELDSTTDITSLRSRLEAQGVGMGTLSKTFAIPVLDREERVEGLITLNMVIGYLQGVDERPNTKLLNEIQPSVLIVGGAGYIGSVLVDEVLKAGWRVCVVDKGLYGFDSLSDFASNPRFRCIDGDITNLGVQVDAIAGIDCVVFLAEIVGDPSCKYVPATALKTNYLAVSSMATLCAHMQINRFIYTSSCSVYGASKNPDLFLDERSALSPVSHYARMKIAAEEALYNQLSRSFAPTILRLATVFVHSYRPRFDLVVNVLTNHAFNKKKLPYLVENSLDRIYISKIIVK